MCAQGLGFTLQQAHGDCHHYFAGAFSILQTTLFSEPDA